MAIVTGGALPSWVTWFARREATEPCPEPLIRPGQAAAMVATLPAKNKDDSWLGRLKSDVASWRKRWLGK